MDEKQLALLSDDKFFELFLAATKSTYKEYCEFKAEQEGLNSYDEPVMSAAFDQFESRLLSVKGESK